MSPDDDAIDPGTMNFLRNFPYAKGEDYQTKLGDDQEQQFLQWVHKNKIPFDPSQNSDYDMRGYYKAMQAGDDNAKRAENGHFPDTYKTPFHQTFSNESIYATKDAPHWDGNTLIDKFGNVIKRE